MDWGVGVGFGLPSLGTNLPKQLATVGYLKNFPVLGRLLDSNQKFVFGYTTVQDETK